MVAWLELMRPKNLVLGAITVPLGAAFILERQIIDELLIISLQTIAVMFFIGAGNVMNDIKDYEIDKLAHPKRPLPSGQISLLAATKFSWILWVLSILCLASAIYFSMDFELWWATIVIYAIAVVLMVSYDHGPKTKEMGLQGNIAISLMVAAVIIYGASSVGGLLNPLIWWVFGVVFFTNLAREIIKDCQDIVADEGQRTTLPMKIGLEKSRMAAYVIIMAALVCLYMPYWRGPFEFGQLVFQTPAILVLITLNGPLFKGEDALVSGRIRAAMLLGLIGFLLPMFM
jgi:geranylgeranylglycerol-phosphate geranylgeranyltransferase